MARSWKRHVERLLARTGVSRAVLAWQAPSTLVLAYHNIVPRGETAVGDLSLHVDQEDFARHLDIVAETHDIVSLKTAFDRNATQRTRPIAVITFDDAYDGALTAGAEELQRRALPATMFVAPGLLEQPGFWWDILAVDSRGLSSEIREHALTQLAGRQDLILGWASTVGLSQADLPDHARPQDVDSLLRLSEEGVVSLGAHTWGHPNLTQLDAEELASELARPRSWLRERTSSYVDWLAYPYGLAGERERAQASASFEGALMISGGLAERRGRRGHPHAVARVNVPRGVTPEGLVLRLAGVVR